MHRLLGKLKILQIGQEDKGKFAALVLARLNHLQPVHHRHTDIRDDDIWPHLQDQTNGGMAVGSFPHNTAVMVLPVNKGGDPRQNQRFVVDQNDSVHKKLLLYILRS